MMTQYSGAEDGRAILLEHVGIVSGTAIYGCDTMLAITKRMVEAIALV